LNGGTTRSRTSFGGQHDSHGPHDASCRRRDDGLYLLQGTPRRWFEQGREIEISSAPTNYGELSLKTHSGHPTQRSCGSMFQIPQRPGPTPLHIKAASARQRQNRRRPW